MKDKLVTVFGAGGFIGRYVCQALLRAGARVRAAERDPRQAYFLKPLGGLGQTQFVAADLLRPDTVTRAVSGADAVVNLVGSFTGNLVGLHVAGAVAVAEAARENDAALVHVSAIGADAASGSLYGRTKGEGERAVQAALPTATIVRPSTVFGREDQFVNRFAGMIAALPVVPVLKPEARFQPLFAGDLAEAIVAALAKSARHGGAVFELGGPDIMTMLQLQRWIAGAIGRDPAFVPLPDVAGSILSMLPGGPISRDQWKLLQHDAIAAPGSRGLAELGVALTPLDAVAPAWLVRFRRAGRFGARAALR